MRTLKIFYPTIMLVLLLGSSARAQITTAELYGHVTDSGQAAVSNASVTITNELTGAVKNTTSNENGDFTFNLLPVGRYTVSIEVSGFKRLVRNAIDLSAGQKANLNFGLEVGTVNEQVNVTLDQPLIETASPQQRVTFGADQLTELPLGKRDWTNVLKVQSGVDTTGSAGNAGGISLNGLPPSAVSLTIDGTDASGNPEVNSLTLFQGYNVIKGVSLETIGEVNIIKGIAPADIANTLSGNINLITKGGTNRFSGSLFENYQTAGLNARRFFSLTKPKTIFHQFGGSFGGPIIKNKLFFFGAYEGYRQNDYAVINGFFPTQSFRDQITAAIPGSRSYLELMPLPNQTLTNPFTGRFIGASSLTAQDNHVDVRIDYNITDSDVLTGRFTTGRPDQVAPRFFPNSTRSLLGKNDALNLRYIRSTGAYSSETRFGFKRADVARDDTLVNPVIILNAFTTSAGVRTDAFDYGGEYLRSAGDIWNVDQNIAISRGRHSIRFGTNFEYVTQTRTAFESPLFVYANATDLLSNSPTRVQFTFGVAPYLLTSWSNGYYIQDDFKIRPNLILNLGMRWDYYAVPNEKDGKLFNRGTNNGFGPILPADEIYKADYNNFAPRVGFAYTLGKEARTVVRGGFGMFYVRPPLYNALELVRNSLDEPVRVNLTSKAAIAPYNLRYPLTNEQALPLFRNPNTPWSTSAISEDFPTPYSMQYTITMEHQLTKTLAAETSYVGTRGDNLVLLRLQNLPDRQTGVSPTAGFLTFRYFDTSDRTRYNSWQTSLRSRFTNGFNFNTHYTLSKVTALFNADVQGTQNGIAPQDPNNLAAELGPAPFDVRHRLAGDFIYEFPFGKWFGSDTRAKKLLFNGWQVTSIFTVQSGSVVNVKQNSTYENQRPDFVSGISPYTSDPNNALRYLNPAAFTSVPNSAAGFPIRPGSAGHNAYRLPGWWNVDISVSKNFQFTERLNLQIGVDMFNAFNHTVFSAVESRVGNGSFGLFTAARDPRIVQLNGKFRF